MSGPLRSRSRAIASPTARRRQQFALEQAREPRPVNVSNGSGQAVSLICALGEAGPAYSFDVPGNPGGPGPYRTLVSFAGRSGSSGVPLGCHVWGDPAQPVANVTVSGSIQASSLASVTVQP
jgi:hypothetical protein